MAKRTPIQLGHLQAQIAKTRELPRSLMKTDDYIARGNAYVQLGLNEDAARDYDAAIELDANNDVALYNRGRVFITMGRFGDAYHSFERAQEVNPFDSDIPLGRGMALEHLGNLDEALSVFDAAVDNNPRDATAISARGLAHRKNGNEEEATNDFRQATQLGSTAPSYHYNHAAYLANQGNETEAKVELKAAFDKKPLYLSLAFQEPYFAKMRPWLDSQKPKPQSQP